MKVANRISTGYKSRLFQEEIHKNLKRFNVLVLHRRAGKSTLAVNEIIHQALTNEKRDPVYAYIGLNYGSVKRTVWDVFKTFTREIPGVSYNEAELRIDIQRPWKKDKIKIYLLGSENPDSLLGMYLDGCVMDEFARMDPSVWTRVILPTLADRKGWAILCSTPKGIGLFKTLYDYAGTEEGVKNGWFRALYTVEQTGALGKDEIEIARASMSEEEFSQEFLCSWSAPNSGSYYGKEIAKARKDGRICNVPYEKSLGTITAWDLGVSDTTCVWFSQMVGKEIRFIDYIEMSGEGLEYYANELKSRGYFYEEHLFPHDIAVRELGSGRSRLETLKSLKVHPVRVVPRQSVEDGINAVRMILSRSWFDEKKCARGISALESYSRKWDEKAQMWTSKPLHDWSSNGADALRTFSMGMSELSSRYRHDLEKIEHVADTDYDIYNY